MKLRPDDEKNPSGSNSSGLLDELSEEQKVAIEQMIQSNHHDALFWIAKYHYINNVKACFQYIIHHHDEYLNSHKAIKTVTQQAVIKLDQNITQVLDTILQSILHEDKAIEEISKFSSNMLDLMRTDNTARIHETNDDPVLKKGVLSLYQAISHSNKNGETHALLFEVCTLCISITTDLVIALHEENNHHFDGHLIEVLHLYTALYESFELTEPEKNTAFLESITYLFVTINYHIPQFQMNTSLPITGKIILARFYLENQQIAEAKKSYEYLIECESAINLLPNCARFLPSIYEDYATLCILEGDTQKGLTFLEQSIKWHHRPTDINYEKLFSLHLRVSLIYLSIVHYDTCWQHLERAENCVKLLHPNDTQHYLLGPIYKTQASVLLAKDMLSKAKPYLDKALAIYDSYPHFSEPEKISTSLVHAQFFYGMQQFDDAERKLRLTIDMQKNLTRPEEVNIPYAYIFLAKLLAQKPTIQHRLEAFELLTEVKKDIEKKPHVLRSVLMNQITTDENLMRVVEEFETNTKDSSECCSPALLRLVTESKPLTPSAPISNDLKPDRSFRLFCKARANLFQTINEIVKPTSEQTQADANDSRIELTAIQKLLAPLDKVIDQTHCYYDAQGILEQAEANVVVLQKSQPEIVTYRIILNHIHQVAVHINSLIQIETDQISLYQRKTSSIKYQLLHLQNNSHVWTLLQTTLSSIKNLVHQHQIKLHIRYAWPSYDEQHDEAWVQPLLNQFYDIFSNAGITPIMDIRDQHCDGLSDFSERVQHCQNVLLIGTPSLRQKQDNPLLRIDRIKHAKEVNSSQKILALRLIGAPEECYLKARNVFDIVFDGGDDGIITLIEAIITSIVFDTVDQDKFQLCWHKIKKDKQALQFMQPLTELETVNCQQLDKQYQSKLEELVQQPTYQFVQRIQNGDVLFTHREQKFGTNNQANKNVPFGGVFQLPSRLAHFTGRKEQLEKLTAFCNQNQMTVVRKKQGQKVSGTSGIGKTQLMVELAHQQITLHQTNQNKPEQGYAAVLFFYVNPDLDNVDSVASQFVQLAQELGINTQQYTGPDLIPTVYEALCQWLGVQQRCLIMFDNATTAQSIMRYLPPKSSQFTSVITTRNSNRQDWIGFENVALDIFSMDDAFDYIHRMLIVKHSGEDASLLAEATGRYPLSMTAAIAYINTTKTSIQSYISQLNDQKKLCLEVFSSDDPYQQSVYAALQLSISSICSEQSQTNRDALAILQACCFLSPEVPIDQKLLCQWANDEVASNQALSVLRTYSLINHSIIGHIRIHQAVQDTIQLMMVRNSIPNTPIEKNLTILAERLTRFYNSSKYDRSRSSVNVRLEPHLATVKQRLKKEQQEGGSLLYFHHQYQIIECQLCSAAQQHDGYSLRTLSEELLAINWMKHNIDPSKILYALLNLASAHIRLRNIGQAKIICLQAKIYVKQLNKNDTYNIIHLQIAAEIEERQGNLIKAEKKCKKALTLLTALNADTQKLTLKTALHHTLSNIYSSMGDCERQQEQNKLASQYSKQSSAIQFFDPVSIPLNRANYLLAVGEYDLALTLFIEIKDEFIKCFSADHQEMELIYYGLARCYLSLGNHPSSLKYATLSLNIAKRNTHEQHKNLIEDCILLGEIYAKTGDHKSAENYFDKSLSLSKQAFGDNHPKLIKPLCHLGNLYLETKNTKAHQTLFEQLKTISEACTIPNHPELVWLRITLANVSFHSGDSNTAVEHCKQGLMIAEQVYPDGHNKYVEIYILLCQNKLNKGEVEDALNDAKKAIECVVGTSVESKIKLADALNNYGKTFFAHAKFKEAIEQHEQALAIQKSVYHSEHPDMIETLTNLGNTYEHLGDDNNALEKYIQANNIADHIYKTHQYESIYAFIPLARYYKKQHHLHKAQALYTKACAIIENEFDLDNLNLVSLLTESASLQQELAAYDQAKQNLLRAEQIAEQHKNEYPMTLVEVYTTLAQLYLELGEYPIAQNYAKKAQAIQKDRCHKNHPDLVEINILLGDICGANNQFPAQKDYYDAALAILQTIHNASHPDMADLFGKYAKSYAQQLDHPTQVLYMNKALVTLINCYGDNSPMIANTICELCETLLTENQINEAAELLRRSQKIKFEPDDPRLVSIKMVYATLASRQNNLDGLLEHYQDAIAIEQEILGLDHLQLACTHSICGNNLLLLGQFQKALKCYQLALIIRESQLGPNHPTVARTFVYLGKANRGINLEESLRCYQKAADIYRRCYSENHHLTIETDSLVGHALIRCNKPSEAITCLQSALSRGCTIYCKNHPQLIGVRISIAKAKMHLGQYEQAQDDFEQLLAIETETTKHSSESNRFNKITILNSLGLTLFLRDLPNQARECFQRALTITSSSSQMLYEAHIASLTFLGQTFIKDDPEKAKTFFNQATDLDKSWHKSDQIENILILQCLIEISDPGKDSVQLKKLIDTAVKKLLQLYPHLSQSPHNVLFEAVNLSLRVNNLSFAKAYCDTVFCLVNQKMSNLEHICAATLFDISELHLQMEEEIKAFACLERSYALQRQTPLNYSLLVRTLGSLSQVSYVLDKDQKMHYYFKRVKAVLENKGDLLDKDELSPSLLMVGRIAIVTEERTFGRKILYKGLQGLLHKPKLVPLLNEKTIFCYGLLADTEVECENFTEAKSILIDAVKYAQNHVDHNKFKVAMALLLLTQYYLEHGEVKDANDLYSILFTYLDTNEIDNKPIVNSLLAFSEQFITEQQFDAAIPYLKQAVNLQNDKDIDVKMATLNKLISALTICQRYDESLPYRKVLTALLNQFSSEINPLIYLQCKMQYIGELLVNNQHQEAFRNACEVLTLSSSVYQEDDPQLITIHLTHAKACLGVNKKEVAKKQLEQAVNILNIVDLKPHRVLALIIQLVKLLIQKNELPEAIARFEQLLHTNPEDLNNGIALTFFYTQIVCHNITLNQYKIAKKTLREAHEVLSPLINADKLENNLLIRLINIHTELDDVDQAYYFLNQLFELITSEQQTTKARIIRSTLDQAGSSLEKCHNTVQVAELCILIVLGYHLNGEKNQCEQYVNKAYEIANHFTIDSKEHRDIRSMIFHSYLLPYAQYKECISHLETELRIVTQPSKHDPQRIVTLHLAIAEYYTKIGQINIAQKHFQLATRVENVTADTQSMITFVDGLLSVQTGQHMGAVRLFKSLLSQDQTESNFPLQALCYIESVYLILYKFGDIFDSKICIESILNNFEETSINPLITSLYFQIFLYIGDTLFAHHKITSTLPNIRKKFGTQHPFYADALLITAQISHRLGRDELAQQNYFDALKIHAEYFGTNNYLTARTRYQYATLLYEIEKHKEAREHFEVCLPIFIEQYSGTNWHVVSTRCYLNLLNGNSISPEHTIQQKYLEQTASLNKDMLEVIQKCLEQKTTLTSSDILNLIAELNHAGLYCYVKELTPYLFIENDTNPVILENYILGCKLTNQFHRAKNFLLLARRHKTAPELVAKLETTINQASENINSARQLTQQNLDIKKSSLVVTQQVIIQLIEQGEYHQAIVNLQLQIAETEKNGLKATLLSMLAQCYMMNGEINEALESMQKCVCIQPHAQHLAFLHNIKRTKLFIPTLLQVIKKIHFQFSHQTNNTAQLVADRGLFATRTNRVTPLYIMMISGQNQLKEHTECKSIVHYHQ